MVTGRTSNERQKLNTIAVHSQQAEEFTLRYQALAADAYDSCFSYSRKRLDVWMNRYLPENSQGLRLLDVGCGTGHHMLSLRKRGFATTGVDGSQEMLEQARMNNPGSDFHYADVERLPFPDASFDVVLCVEVLRYLPNPSRCIGELARVLKPGGMCLASATPLFNLNGYWLVNRMAVALPIKSFVRLKQFFFTSGRLDAEFVRAGFEPPAIHGVYIGPINWVGRLYPGVLPRLLRAWEPYDERLADHPWLRNFSNMFLIRAVRS